jgi:hypothetical protein
MTKQYLEDFAAGQVYRSNRLQVDKEQIGAMHGFRNAGDDDHRTVHRISC